MSLAMSVWPDCDEPGPSPSPRCLSVPLGHLDRAEAAAAEGDIAAAEHFFALADAQVRRAVALAMVVNHTADAVDADGAERLREIAARLSDASPEPARGWALVFRHPEDEAYVSVWLRLGSPGPETGALRDIAVPRLPA